jgi:O-acetyl-ADP-ribose deacetylase (regulator of RNase III)
MTPIKYVKGSATDIASFQNNAPNASKHVIAHICNDYGGWGSGFVLALSKLSTLPEKAYRAIPPESLYLGFTFLVEINPTVSAANMVAQHGNSRPGEPAVRYPTLALCLNSLAVQLEGVNTAVHMPRIGCGLGGGNWETIEPIIEEYLSEWDIQVVVYDL